MDRAHYVAAWSYVAICGAAIGFHVYTNRPAPAPAAATAAAPTPVVDLSGRPGSTWFAAVRRNCNAVEVEVAQRQSPPPATTEGAGYGAACYALAGKMDRARAAIERLPPADRGAAADIVFEVCHPVADAGDDESAGPMMELVLDYRPTNYMALYHAGMSEYALGQSSKARAHLAAFMDAYASEDGWRGSARATLARIDSAGARE